MKSSKGFTLIEIAIVLVIIGLLLGGVLKGQELVTSARVRNLITQQEGIKAAFFGFQDRYRALPGDYASADVNMVCGAIPCAKGDGNGRIDAPNTGGTHEEYFDRRFECTSRGLAIYFKRLRFAARHGRDVDRRQHRRRGETRPENLVFEVADLVAQDRPQAFVEDDRVLVADLLHLLGQ
jgi:prepilin-type N-terminal cleavage/methylation domain-containing protein